MSYTDGINAISSNDTKKLKTLYTKDATIFQSQDNLGLTLAHRAAFNNNPANLRMILALDKKCLHIKDKTNKTIGHYAAGYGKLANLKLILENSPDILNQKDFTGMSALHYAAENNCTDTFEEILKRNSEAIEERDYKGNTALHFASAKGHTQIMGVVYKYKNDILFDKNTRGETCAHHAAKNDKKEALELLYSLNFEAILTLNHDNNSPLDVAKKHNNHSVIEYLTNSYRNIVTKSQSQSLMHWAAMRGKTDVIKILAALYPNTLLEKNEYGRLPIHTAVENCQFESILVLYRLNKPTIMSRDYNNNGVEHIAAGLGNIAIIDTLEKLEYSPFLLPGYARKNLMGKTSAEIAISSGNVELLKSRLYLFFTREEKAFEAAIRTGQLKTLITIKELFKNIKVQSSNGNTAAHLAAIFGHPHILEFINKHSPSSLITPNKHGYTPTHLAAIHGKSNCIETIEKRHPDSVSCANNQNRDTAAHLACWKGHMETLQTIIRLNMLALNAKDINNMRPIDIAKKYTKQQILQYLETLKNRKNGSMNHSAGIIKTISTTNITTNTTQTTKKTRPAEVEPNLHSAIKKRQKTR